MYIFLFNRLCTVKLQNDLLENTFLKDPAKAHGMAPGHCIYVGLALGSTIFQIRKKLCIKRPSLASSYIRCPGTVDTLHQHFSTAGTSPVNGTRKVGNRNKNVWLKKNIFCWRDWFENRFKGFVCMFNTLDFVLFISTKFTAF